MKHKVDEFWVDVVIYFVVIVFLLAAWAGVNLLLAWLTVAVVGGFGAAIPFWPTFGALFLVQLVMGGVGQLFSKS